MVKTRNNHYVPQWYQRGFQSDNINELHYLNLDPDTKELPNGRIITMNDRYVWPTSKCFVEKDLYTTFFGSDINDEIERKLFGRIDDIGVLAIRAFISDDPSEWHYNIRNFFEYIDAQKLRTPKGLFWIKKLNSFMHVSLSNNWPLSSTSKHSNSFASLHSRSAM